MGLEDYLLTAVLRGVLAQRLVRRLCHACRRAEPRRRPSWSRASGWTGARERRPITLWHPVGCPQCRNTGYRGRLAIAEFLAPDAAIERLIFARADHAEIERAAVAGGMVTMFDAGLDAALAGDDHDRGSRAQHPRRGLTMPRFRYTAIDAAGATTRGVMEAADRGRGRSPRCSARAASRCAPSRPRGGCWRATARPASSAARRR